VEGVKVGQVLDHNPKKFCQVCIRAVYEDMHSSSYAHC